jgi:hypothetical protein
MLLSLAGCHQLLASLAMNLASGYSSSSCGQAGFGTAPASLRLGGLVATPRPRTAAELTAQPHCAQTATGKDGQTHPYCGVALREVLHLASAPEGQVQHGPTSPPTSHPKPSCSPTAAMSSLCLLTTVLTGLLCSSRKLLPLGAPNHEPEEG